jgi:hypothetical protein
MKNTTKKILEILEKQSDNILELKDTMKGILSRQDILEKLCDDMVRNTDIIYDEDKITWKKMKNTVGICDIGLEKIIDELGGDGITLPQARKACKDGIFSFSVAVRAATTLELPNWEKALGKMVAHVHPKAKKYYENEEAYLHNQKALEEGRLKDIAGWFVINDNIYRDDSYAYLVAAAEADRAAWTAEAAWATDRAAWTAVAAERAATVAAVLEAAVDDVDDLIDIYFDVLEDNDE